MFNIYIVIVFLYVKYIYNLLVFNVVCMFIVVCYLNIIFNSYMLKKVIIIIEFINYIEIWIKFC